MTDALKQRLRAALVALVKSQIGQEEIPRGSNWGGKVIAYLLAVGIKSPASWCLAFVIWCILHACASAGLSLSDTALIATGYCPDEFNHCKAAGTAIDAFAVLRGEDTVLPGDVMLMWEDDLNGYHHAGVVVLAPSKGKPEFDSVEGNTNHSGARQGYAVMRQVRDASDKTSDGHNKYCFLRLV